MAELFRTGNRGRQYRDSRFDGSRSELERKLSQSSTLYVGNLSFYTTEEQIYALFSKCGEIKRIIMGLDRVKKTPCGFCFVEYMNREAATAAMKWINGTRLDDRYIRTDWDAGFTESRQYGRGQSGGQVRDEFRDDYDPGRGGYGKQVQTPPEAKRDVPTHYVHASGPIQGAGAFSEASSKYGDGSTAGAKRDRATETSGTSNVAKVAKEPSNKKQHVEGPVNTTAVAPLASQTLPSEIDKDQGP